MKSYYLSTGDERGYLVVVLIKGYAIKIALLCQSSDQAYLDVLDLPTSLLMLVGMLIWQKCTVSDDVILSPRSMVEGHPVDNGKQLQSKFQQYSRSIMESNVRLRLLTKFNFLNIAWAVIVERLFPFAHYCQSNNKLNSNAARKISIYCRLFLLCISSSGCTLHLTWEVTTNSEIRAEIFCVQTWFHIMFVCLSISREDK